jgi:hypothetical protein
VIAGIALEFAQGVDVRKFDARTCHLREIAWDGKCDLGQGLCGARAKPEADAGIWEFRSRFGSL